MISLEELIAQKEALERQIDAKRTQDRAAAVEKIRALMLEYGLEVADLSTRKVKKTGGSKVAAKYRDKATGDSWSGRGLQPKWLKAAMASGRKLQDFAV